MSFSFTPNTREVLEQLVRDARFRSLTRLPLFAPMEIGLVLAAFALFGLSTWAYLANRLPWYFMVIANGFAVYASFTPLHDATHRTVSCSRWLNDLIGTLSCLLLLPGITTGIYRYLHLEHHRYAGDPVRDPDEPFVASRGWRVALVLAFLDVLWTRFYLEHRHARSPRENAEFYCGLGFYIAVHVIGLGSTYAQEFFLCWMIPQRLGLFTVAYLFARVQHPEGVTWEQAPFQATVRIQAKPWTRWLMLGQSKHHIHHLAPSLPYYRYHLAWDLGQHLLEKQHIPSRTLWRSAQDLRLPQRDSGVRYSARVVSVLNVADDVRAYDLVPLDGATWPAFDAGAHIDVDMAPGLLRQYSLCNDPGEANRYRIAVRHAPLGRGGSHYLHTRVKPGDTLTIGAPRNHFPLSFGFDDYLLLAGGIGVTPLLAMAYALHAANKSFELHQCARNHGALAFRDERTDLPFAERVNVWLDDAAFEARFDAHRVLGDYRPGRVLYLCGPAGFMQHVLAAARARAWPVEAIFSETFVPPTIDASQNRRFEVELRRSGKSLIVEPEESLIDVLHANGCRVMCSCTQGICGSCMTPVLEGEVDHRDAIMTESERAANRQMTVCVSRARGDRLVLDL